LAVGDCHVEDEAPKLLGAMMKDLKVAGVDTIYVEISEGDLDFMQKLEDNQLRDYANGKEVSGRTVPTPKILSQEYGAHSDNSPREWGLMILGARINGIEVVNIDKRIVNLSGDKRVAHTNLEWADAIKHDRASNNKTGKYIVWGGFGHFADMGAVDEALGIPSITFDKSFSPFGFEAKKDSGFDFILRGGLDHYDVDKARDIRPTDLPIPPQEERTK
jgi:hypothetical protein